MNVKRREPHERSRPDLTPEDWARVVEWRPLIYGLLRQYGSHILKRQVTWRGRIGEDSFRWSMDRRSSYGVDPVSIMQDLEFRALEAAAKAFHRYDEERGGGAYAVYLRKIIMRELSNEFHRWVTTSSSVDLVNYGLADDPDFDFDEPSYVEEFDQEAPSGLAEEDEARLEVALGALSSKEAIAIRMLADGTPVDLIAENLGFKSVEAAHKLIRRARDKASRAWENHDA